MDAARRLPAVSVAAILVAAVAGCGGSSSTTTANTPTTTTTTTTSSTTTTSTTTPQLTREQFASKLDDLCKRLAETSARDQAEASKAIDASDYNAAASAFEKLNRTAARFYEQIAALTAPPAEQPAFARYKQAVARGNGLRDRIVPALRARDTEEVSRLSDLADGESKARTKAAIDLGTKHCGT
jgi:hypothetical protein